MEKTLSDKNEPEQVGHTNLVLTPGLVDQTRRKTSGQPDSASQWEN